jgi:hypothetical protein
MGMLIQGFSDRPLKIIKRLEEKSLSDEEKESNDTVSEDRARNTKTRAWKRQP